MKINWYSGKNGKVGLDQRGTSIKTTTHWFIILLLFNKFLVSLSLNKFILRGKIKMKQQQQQQQHLSLTFLRLSSWHIFAPSTAYTHHHLTDQGTWLPPLCGPCFWFSRDPPPPPPLTFKWPTWVLPPYPPPHLLLNYSHFPVDSVTHSTLAST